MSKVFIEENSLTSIADTIRKYTGNDSKLSVPNGFKEAIRNLVTTEETQTGSVLILNDIPNGTGNISEVHLFGKTTQDGTPTPDVPIEIKQIVNPTVSIAGKNLLDCSNKDFSTKCYINATATILGRSLQNDLELGYCFPVVQGKYNISASTNFRTAFSREKLDENANGTINVNGVITTNAKATIEVKTNGYIYVCNSSDFYKNEKNLMISKIETNEYEPYKPIQSVAFNYSLNGIDDIRDELIVRADGTGQLIQKLAKKIIDGSNITTSVSVQQEGSYLVDLEAVSDMLTGNYNVGLSTIATNKGSGKEKNTIRFGANNKNVYLYLDESFAGKTATELREYFTANPFTIVYPLEEPIVNELSTEEVQKVLALNTYKPITTIWNDKDAEIEITYDVIVKNRIEGKNDNSRSSDY